MDMVKVMAITGSATVLFLVLELIRRGRLKERYSLLWLFAGAVMLILSLRGGCSSISPMRSAYTMRRRYCSSSRSYSCC